MGTPQNLFGPSRTLPADGDTNWGSEIREILIDMMKAMDNMSNMVTDDLPFLVMKPAATTVTVAEYCLAVVNNRHDVIGDSAAVNLEEIDTGAEYADGQTLLLMGQSDSFTVEMDSDDSTDSGYRINGDMILGANDAIFLAYDSSIAKWQEISRSN